MLIFKKTGEPEKKVKCANSETSLLSPPSPFDRPSALASQKTFSPSKKLDAEVMTEWLEKRYGSEPCILEPSAMSLQGSESKQKHHRTPSLSYEGRYRSADLSLKGLDKCSRIRARSLGQINKPLPRTAYPMPIEMKKSPPIKLAVVHPGKPHKLLQCEAFQ